MIFKKNIFDLDIFLKLVVQHICEKVKMDKQSKLDHQTITFETINFPTFRITEIKSPCNLP